MRSVEKLVLWVYAFLFTFLMLLLALMSAGLWKEPLFALDQALNDLNQSWLIGISAILLFMIGVYILINNFRAKQVVQTIIKTTQLGDICISLDAIEALVVKAAGKVPGLREIKPVIKPAQQGIAILIKGTVTAEDSIPQMSLELQDIVRNTVEAIAGVPVIEVRVVIQGITRDLRGRVE
jgi:uncharacterized alkaline shock family protein YloU